MSTKESKSYEQMTTTVENIIEEISKDDVSLDNLLTKVEQGYKILKKMDKRLNEVHMKLEDIQKEYNEKQS
jgi:exodeoxyribonuclease VII small subunit